MPAGHDVQTGGAVDVAAVVWTVPAAQAPCALHWLWSAWLEYVPAAQVAQTRSALALPAVEMYVPGAQSLHVEQLAASVVVLKVPEVHAAQVRSVVALPADATDWPARHSVWATHAVDAVPSLSQVPAAHGCSAFVPPAQ